MAVNPFKQLHMEPTFFIDEQRLQESYRALIQKVHPDKFQTKVEKDQAVIMAVTLNDAYEMIKRPMRRAEALLYLKGVAVHDICKDPALLMEMMELRENGDVKQIQIELAKASKTFGKAFDDDDTKAMEKEFLRMQYLAKMLSDQAKEQKRACGQQG